MKKELYEQVLEAIKKGGYTLKEYNQYDDVPHYVWYGMQYLSNKQGMDILAGEFEKGTGFNTFACNLSRIGVDQFNPFIVSNNEEKTHAICLAICEFLRYDKDAMCFTVSRYINGYDEIKRNCMPWGKLLTKANTGTQISVVILSTVIWYNFVEVCSDYLIPMALIKSQSEEIYSVLKSYMKIVCNFNMLDYEYFKANNFMVEERINVMEHLKVIGSKVYNFKDMHDKTALRFCYNKRNINVEWKDGATHLSTLVTFEIPVITMPEAAFIADVGKGDKAYVVRLCLAGLLARCGVAITWDTHEYIISQPFDNDLNCNSITVNSFADIF